MLEPAELALDRSALAVQVAVPLCVARDEGVHPVSAEPHRRGLALSGGAPPLGSASVEVGSCECPLAMHAVGPLCRVAGALALFERDDRHYTPEHDHVVQGRA